ncbi:uncharacterized protein B0H18DRAFT_991041 [Fomitopsis serialis]|uniref:uncharacterized protein n=1 Tax=Fomitopsis serialis TaxID=139415 RepID=UPI002007D882|nr:uncharacterized protein B0H18DRAFT_991041 [Neoantrodia serialis]KAH9931303.1 hypothetical protein B0H18DRAFT_991041 [Neoantrodia serialis]
MDCLSEDEGIHLPKPRLGRLQRLTLSSTRSKSRRTIVRSIELGACTSVSMYGGSDLRDPLILDDIQRSRGPRADQWSKIYLLRTRPRTAPGTLRYVNPRQTHCVLCENMDIVGAEWKETITTSEGSVQLVSSVRIPAQVDTSLVREAWIIELSYHDEHSKLGFSSSDLVSLMRRMPALESLTMSDETLSRFCQSLMFARDTLCPRLSSVHILLNGCSSGPVSILRPLVAILRSLPRRVFKVKIGYLPGFKKERVYATEFDAFFDSVEYVSYTEMPHMEMPPVYRADPHSFWPSWPLPKWKSQLEMWSRFAGDVE